MRLLTQRIMIVSLLIAAVAMGADQVKDVKIRALDDLGTDATDVLSFCSVKPGMEATQEAVSKDVRALVDTGRFSYTGVEIEKADGGVNVVYLVRRRHRFQEPLAIKGNDYLSERKIRKYAELKSGDYIDDAILATKAGKVRDEYVKRYFPNAQIKVVAEPITNSAGYANVTLTIEEGQRQKISDFCFTNNPSIQAEDLRISFDEYPWYNPIGWFTDRPTSQQDLEDARAKALQVYLDRGYLDAKVDFPVAVKVDETHVNMLMNVTEGDLYTIETTSIRGVKLFPEETVLACAKINADEIAGQQALADAAKRIKDYFGQRGYIDTVVRPLKDTVPGKPGRVAVVFDVREGELAYIRNIEIRGNNKTKDRVIRREIQLNPGEIMDEVRIERSENRMKNLGYFSEVRHYYERTDENDKRNLVYEVQEQRTGNFMVGVGLSTVDSIFGYGEVSQSNFDILNWPNFTGGGEKARIGVEYGERRQTFEASWTQPWLFSYPMALTVDLYRRLRWTDQYDEIRTGSSATLSYPIFFGRIGGRYTLEVVDMQDPDENQWYLEDGASSTPGRADSKYFLDQDDKYGGNLNSVFRLFWSHDTRDKAFVPTRGYQSTVYGEISENSFGDNAFYRMGANHRHYFPLWFKHVLMLRGRVDTIDAYEDELPVYEMLYLGGPRTIRGVDYRDIGPKVFRNGHQQHAPVGGKTLALVTAEYTVPIIKAVRAAVFSDAGSLGADAWGGGLDNVCISGGVGLRIDIPGFPIRLDVAKPFVTDDDYTDEEVFSFTIGFE